MLLSEMLLLMTEAHHQNQLILLARHQDELGQYRECPKLINKVKTD